MTGLVEKKEDPAAAERGRGPLATLWLVATSLALVAAVIYMATVLWKRLILGHFANVSRDLAWMSPISNLVWFGLAWVPAALIGKAAGFATPRGLRAGVWFLGTVFVFSLFLPFTAIHRVAALVFSAGLGSVIARAFTRAPAAWEMWLGRTRLALLGGSVAAGVVLTVGREVGERRHDAGLGQAPPGSPNVILLVMDTMRGDVLQAAGYPRRVMPFVDSLAAANVYFAKARSTAPWTLPSHGSMFTGRYVGELSTTKTEPLDGQHRTLGEVFTERGYYTAGFSANLHYASWESGINRGFAEWNDYQRSVRQVLRSSSIGQTQLLLDAIDAPDMAGVWEAIKGHDIFVHPKPQADIPTATDITSRFLRWHANRPQRPFFAFLNYFDSHWRYEPPDAYRTRFSPSPKHRDLYDAELAYEDDELRRLFGELERRGALSNTWIVITADHGEEFNEHGHTQHGNTLYNSVLHVPLMVIGPRQAPARIEVPVTLRDLAQTILDLARIQTAALPGVSLLGHVRDPAFRSSPVVGQLGRGPERVLAIYDSTWSLIRDAGGNAELYDLRTDWAQTRNLAGIDSMRPVLDDNRRRLAEVADTTRTRVAASGAGQR